MSKVHKKKRPSKKSQTPKAEPQLYDEDGNYILTYLIIVSNI